MIDTDSKKKHPVQLSYHIQSIAERDNTGFSQRTELRVLQQHRQDTHQPVGPRRDRLPPQHLQPLALHVLVHAC